MPIKKNIKISATKRGHHEKRKKNFLKTKKQLHREKQLKSDIFKKSKNERRKDLIKKSDKNKKKLVSNESLTFKFHNSTDVLDMLSNDSESELNEKVPDKKRRKIENSDDEISLSDSENESDELNDEELEKIELDQKKNSRNEATIKKNIKELLPIKTRTGLMPRNAMETSKEFEILEVQTVKEKEMKDMKDKITKESGAQNNPTKEERKFYSATELLNERQREIEAQKFRIGKISSGITENPEEKIGNLGVLLQLLQEINEDERKNLLSVRKLAMFSITEIFKDIIPDYKIGIVDLESQKVKKDTLARVTYENELLKYYKKFLRELENIVKALKPGKYRKRPCKENINLAECAIFSLCEILQSNSYFNFNTNIAQLLVIYLNCSNYGCRKLINETFVKIFKADKRLDLTLHIVRNINYLVKRNSNSVHSEVVSCLLALQIKNINVDAEKENELKQKKLEQHKSRLISMSKRERKRKKKLSELDKELMETQAEENKQTKQAKLTDISKLVFTIYFRILKESPKSKILNFTLEGLAKFAHIINVEFFSDLINVLNSLIENEDLGYREQLFCIQTVFNILSGQGEALNIDAARFYTHLYKNILCVSAGKNHHDVESIIETLDNILIKRRKNITHLRYIAFLKRLMTLCLQVLHNGALGCLTIIKNSIQLNSSLDILIDTESQIGSGKFNPFVDEPEFSNSNCTSLFELMLLKNHYHPLVVKLSNYISKGCPITQGLEPELSKVTPLEILNKFDSTQMAFKPSIPCPQKELTPNIKCNNFHNFKLHDVNNICIENSKQISSNESRKKLNFNFFTEYQKIK